MILALLALAVVLVPMIAAIHAARLLGAGDRREASE